MKATIKRNLPDAPKPTKPFLGIDYLEAKKLAALAKHPDLDRQFKPKEKHKWTDEEIKTIKRLYNDGKSAPVIAKAMGLPLVSTRSKVYWMVHNGELPSRAKVLSKEEEAKVMEKYKNGATYAQMADEFGVGVTTIGRIIRRNK